MTFKVFQNNTALTVEDLNDVLMEQAVITFNDASERDNAIPSPNVGMHCFLKSDNKTYFYHATAGWVPLLAGTDASGNPYKPVLVTGAAKATGGQLSYNTDTSILSSNGQKVWTPEDTTRRVYLAVTSSNYVTAATGDSILPRSVWVGSSWGSTGSTPVDSANANALGLPTRGLWKVVLNVRGTTTGTGERYFTIRHVTDTNTRWAAQNSVGTGSFSINLTALIDATAPMDFVIGAFTSAGAITIVPTFGETRLSITRLDYF